MNLTVYLFVFSLSLSLSSSCAVGNQYCDSRLSSLSYCTILLRLASTVVVAIAKSEKCRVDLHVPMVTLDKKTILISSSEGAFKTSMHLHYGTCIFYLANRDNRFSCAK